MNFTTENVCVEMPKDAPISAIMNETDNLLTKLRRHTIMNFTTENPCIEMPRTTEPISAILAETDNILDECIACLDKLSTCISGTVGVEGKKADPKCMRDAVKVTADKAKMVLGGIRNVMEAIGV